MAYISIYVYACERDDGLRYAVGAVPAEGLVNGRVGLFEEHENATLFAEALRVKHPDATVAILPSVVAAH